MSPADRAPRRGTRRAATLVIPAASVLRASPGTTRRYRISEEALALDEGLEQAAPAVGDLRLTRTNRGLLVQARVRTALAESCSRCLRDIAVLLELAIEEEALPSVDIATGVALDTSAEPDVVRLSSHHELDVGDLLREAVSLAEPIAPLCRPDCPGLCPVCGGDLSSGPHDHPDEGDSRWTALRRLTIEGG